MATTANEQLRGVPRLRLVRWILLLTLILGAACRGGCEGPEVKALVPSDRDCSDGDPCTIDFWHEHRAECVHDLDPFCTKPCETTEDCAVDPGLAPCVVAECAGNSCSYLELAPQDCAACVSDADCAQEFCAPRHCAAGFCRESPPPSCDDGVAATWDRCNSALGRCDHLLADRLLGCQVDAECATDHPCEQLTCDEGVCQVTAATRGCGSPLDVPRSCEAEDGNDECIQAGAVCVAGPCEDGFCSWREVPNSPSCQPCSGDHECQGSFCQWPVCTGTVCVLEEVPFCQDRDPLTRDICSERLSACLHRFEATPPRCSGGALDDGDPTTVDACDPATGNTVHLPAAVGRCTTTNRCWDVYEAPAGCLATKVECLDDNACPARCDPAVGCVIDGEGQCGCQTDEDCDLGNPCARVVCMGFDDADLNQSGGACWGTLLDGCIPCDGDEDCRVDDWCISGSCAQGFCTYQTQITCDDQDPSTVGFCHGHKDASCTYERLPGSEPSRGCGGPW